jgi:hypothetical protein
MTWCSAGERALPSAFVPVVLARILRNGIVRQAPAVVWRSTIASLHNLRAAFADEAGEPCNADASRGCG